MATCCTQALRKQFASLHEDVDDFCGEFEAWKARGAASEYDSYLFGKDGAYSTPTVGGVPNLLRHVHLVPLANPAALIAWNRQWHRRSKKVSNRALVYASDVTHGHLLIYILAEAHEVARMRTPMHTQLMWKLAHIADRFIQDGTVVG